MKKSCTLSGGEVRYGDSDVRARGTRIDLGYLLDLRVGCSSSFLPSCGLSRICSFSCAFWSVLFLCMQSSALGTAPLLLFQTCDGSRRVRGICQCGDIATQFLGPTGVAVISHSSKTLRLLFFLVIFVYGWRRMIPFLRVVGWSDIS